MIILLIIAVFFSIICYTMADRRGRDKYVGLVCGFIFGIWAVLYYLIAGDTSKKKADLMAEAIKKVGK